MPVKITSNKHHKSLEHDNGHMIRADFYDSLSKFRSCFLVNGNEAPTGSSTWLKFDELDAFADTLCGVAHRFLVIHFGLEQSTLRYGLSMVAGTYRHVAGEAVCYDFVDWSDNPKVIVYSNGLVNISPDEWAPLRSAYKAHMRVMRVPKGQFTALEVNDALRVILPWDREVRAMYEHNARYPAESYRIVLESVSRYHKTSHQTGSVSSPIGHRHGIAFFTQFFDNGKWHDMLNDDIDQVVIYLNKAADYGNMCPVRCSHYQERTLQP